MIRQLEIAVSEDYKWLLAKIIDFGAVQDKRVYTTGHYKIEGHDQFTALVVWVTQEFDVIPNGGGWWKHKTRRVQIQWSKSNLGRQVYSISIL